MQQSQITSKEYSETFQKDIVKAILNMGDDLKTIEKGTHQEYIRLLEMAEATRLRQLAVSEIQYQLAIQGAKHTLDFQKSQIENDYQLARDDIKEKIHSELRKRKKELREILDKIQQQGIQCQDEIKQCNNINIPIRKKERKIQPATFANFKLNENEARQDLAIIKSLTEEVDNKKV